MENPEKFELEKKEEFQKAPIWAPFRGAEWDEDKGYKEPTIEQKEKIDIRLNRLAEVMEGADFPWYLDGAINISLYKEKYIRDHKDLDMSIFAEDFNKFDSLLEKQNFGIFEKIKREDKELWERIHIVKGNTIKEYQAAQIDKRGKFIETDDPFNYIDLHIHSRDKNGNVVINYSGSVLPKEFFKPVKKSLPNGKEINLSQPAIVAYHKLHEGRDYDFIDLKLFRNKLDDKDFKMLHKVLDQETPESMFQAKEKLKEIWSMLDSGMNKEKIKTTIAKHPNMSSRIKNPKIKTFIKEISEYIFSNSNTDEDAFIKQSFKLLGLEKQFKIKIEQLRELEAMPIEK